ncbi:MAG: hypothetical protein ACREE3_10695 [Stellaceae bacterium]
MRYLSGFAVALALVAAGLAPANAAIVGDASVPYSAIRTVTVDGRTYVDRVFHVPGKEREDVSVGGIAIDFILDLDRHRAVAILPTLVSYLEFPLPPLLAQLDRRRLDGKAVGQTRLDGLSATKYRLDYTASDGTNGAGAVWLSRDNILLRIKARLLRPHKRPIRIGMMLSHLKIGPQRRSLFMIPHGLHRIPYAALQALLNLGRRSPIGSREK